MTLARPVGINPTGPTFIPKNITRASAFAAAGVLAAINAQAAQVIDTLKYGSLTNSLASLAGISAVIWIAMFVALKMGFEAGRRRRLSRRDVVVLGSVVALSIVPVSLAAKAALLLCAVYLFMTSRRGDDCHKISILLLALTGPLIWGRLLLNLFAEPILSLDAHIVGTMIGSTVDGNTVRFSTGAARMLIGTPCSSVHNMSLAIVLWVTAAVVFNIQIDRRFMAVGAAMAGLMFVLNVARLAAIGLFPEHYHFLHHGTGAALFGWAGLIGAALIAAAGVSSAVGRQQ